MDSLHWLAWLHVGRSVFHVEQLEPPQASQPSSQQAYQAPIVRRVRPGVVEGRVLDSPIYF